VGIGTIPTYRDLSVPELLGRSATPLGTVFILLERENEDVHPARDALYRCRHPRTIFVRRSSLVPLRLERGNGDDFFVDEPFVHRRFGTSDFSPFGQRWFVFAHSSFRVRRFVSLVRMLRRGFLRFFTYWREKDEDGTSFVE